MSVSGAPELLVIIQPEAFSIRTMEERHPVGETIRELIGPGDAPVVIWADGELVGPERWSEVIPQRHVLIQRLAADADALRLVGFIALAVFAPYAGGSIAGSLGFASTGAVAAGIGAGIGLVGALAINALIPPTLPSVAGAGAPTSLAAITGQSNQVAPFAPIPVVVGKPTYYPPIPMTGLPYTELVGEDQYLRMLVVLGYGPLRIGGVTAGAGFSLIDENTSLSGDPIKIGGVSIDQFDDVEFEIGDPDDVTLFTSSIVETAVNVALDHTTDPTSENQTITDTVDVIQTTETDTDEVSGDVYFPQLYTVSGQGNTRFARVNFQVHRSPPGVGSWTLATSFTVSSNERKPLRRGWRIKLPTSGQYDIRLRRVSTFYGQENAFFSDCTWTVMRSIKRNVRPFDVDDTVVMALRIRATDQLGGQIDRLSIEAQGFAPVWSSGTTWFDTATRNPAWWYAYVLAGTATKSARPVALLDGPTLDAWADWCTANDLNCDMVIDAEGTVFDRAREVASTGFGSWHITDDAKYSIVRDVQSATKMVVTPRNSFGFSSEYTFHRLPHALRVQFWDPVRSEPTERIVYDDGYNATGSGGMTKATKFERLQTAGVQDADHAWKVGRYHLAQLRLRPELYRFGQDIQHLAYQRGDTIELSQDVILVGLKWGRVKSVTLSGTNVTEAEVDEVLYMEPGETYALKIQRKDGTIITEEITTVSPYTTMVTFSTPIAQHNYGAGNEPGLQAGDHFTFGESGSETISAKVTRIEPQGDYRAQITAVPAADDIFDAWVGDIPNFDPVITEPIDLDLLPPVQPTIIEVRSEAPPDATQALQVRLAVHFGMPPGLTGVWIDARVRNTEDISGEGTVVTAWRRVPAVSSEAGVLYVYDVEALVEYEIQIRSRRGKRLSAWTGTTSHTIAVQDWAAFLGINVRSEAGDLLVDVDLRNDRHVTSVLGGFINANASMEFMRRNEDGQLCPASWFGSNDTGDFHFVDDGEHDIMEIDFQSRFVANSLVPINTDHAYEAVLIARVPSGSSSSTVLRLNELEADFPPVGVKAVTAGGLSGEAQVSDTADTVRNIINPVVLSTTWQVFTAFYRPGIDVKWVNLEIGTSDAVNMEVELCGLRDLGVVGDVVDTTGNYLLNTSGTKQDDFNDVVRFTGSGNKVISVPDDCLGKAGRRWVAIREGSGTVTFSQTGSGTINTKGGLAITAQGGSAVLTQLTATVFTLTGDV